jgi:hypothetical protein
LRRFVFDAVLIPMRMQTAKNAAGNKRQTARKPDSLKAAPDALKLE